MSQHAYMIVAHANFSQLCKLVKTLNDSRNDIYIHIDRRSKNVPFDQIKASAEDSNVFFTDRINVNWGGYSLVKARYLLLEAARKNGGYDYYHFLSGADLPLYSQDIIHEFFDRNQGKEFISLSEDRDWYLDRVRFYYPFRDFIGKRNLLGRALNKAFLMIQKKLHVNRLRHEHPDIYVGEEWFSVTEQFVDYVLDNRSLCDQIFSCGDCTDELVFPTLYMMWQKNPRYVSPYTHDLFDAQRMDIVRAIDWNRGHPYTYTTEDFDMLMNSHCLFARKFDETKDSEIIDRIVSNIDAR